MKIFKRRHEKKDGWESTRNGSAPEESVKENGKAVSEGKRTPLSSIEKKVPQLLTALLAGIWVILAILPLCYTREEKGNVPETEILEELISVTEAAKDTAKKETAAPEKETSAKEMRSEIITVPDLSWQDEIFGNGNAAVMTRPVQVTGLTENEKNLTAFRESDFVRGASRFLTQNNIRSSQITFTGSIACSAPEAAAYTADLKGVSDRKLIAVFFPKYPGKYLFMLESVSEKEKEAVPSAETERRTQPQVTQTVPAVSAAPAASQEESESDYDAMRLSVSGLNDELSNYMANTYELQYGLYDYLYGRGIKNARAATVTDYYIDAFERTATIQIDIEGIGKVTAIYERDDNSYSFR